MSLISLSTISAGFYDIFPAQAVLLAFTLVEILHRAQISDNPCPDLGFASAFGTVKMLAGKIPVIIAD
jgi:hypothetical protein